MNNKDENKIEPLSTSESNKSEDKTDVKNALAKGDLVEKRVTQMLKICSFITSIFALIGIIGFIFSYMRYYGFFTYEIFSANHILLFAFFTLLIFLTILALFGSTIMYLYYSLHKDDSSRKSRNLFMILAWTIVVFLGIVLYFANQENIFVRFVYWSNWIVGIILFISLIVPFLRRCLKYVSEIEKDRKIWFVATIFSLIICGYVSFLIFYPSTFVNSYDSFLKFCGLASDRVEIYLKNENESVIGKLIFDDGKYAYVEFNRTNSNCGGIDVACDQTIRKKVPSEDVSIPVPPERQQDK